MADPMTIAEEYLAVWNEDDADRRRRMIAEGWSTEPRYVDPLMAGDGREGVANMIEALRGRFPGHGFNLKGSADGHGQFVRFSWTLGDANGARVVGGMDVVRLDGEGRIAEVIGFLDA
ncbi:MAG: nuclear transport factor 2 family protein [Caulobacteraceae bacterium]|nr:nuclear transport factor 2 family protein [Caulobacteraceae bacterium]